MNHAYRALGRRGRRDPDRRREPFGAGAGDAARRRPAGGGDDGRKPARERCALLLRLPPAGLLSPVLPPPGRVLSAAGLLPPVLPSARHRLPPAGLLSPVLPPGRVLSAAPGVLPADLVPPSADLL